MSLRNDIRNHRDRIKRWKKQDEQKNKKKMTALEAKYHVENVRFSKVKFDNGKEE